jgi:hypothetical protein
VKNCIAWFGLALILSGCITGQQVRDKVREGMTKEQVISAMGNPDGFQRAGEFEALVFTNRLISGWSWDRADYSVILKSDRVVAYGPGQVRQEGPNVLVLVPVHAK